MKAKIMFYRQDNLNQNEKFKLRRKLLGVDQKSNYGKYQYRIEGLVDKIPNYRPIRSSIIVLKEDLNKVLGLFNEFKVKNEVFDVEIQKAKLLK